VIFLLVVLIIGVVCGMLLTYHWIGEDRTYREAALEAEVRALRNAQRLALQAYRAQHEMRQVAEEYRPGRSLSR
jgi:hypothetical protein